MLFNLFKVLIIWFIVLEINTLKHPFMSSAFSMFILYRFKRLLMSVKILDLV